MMARSFSAPALCMVAMMVAAAEAFSPALSFRPALRQSSTGFSGLRMVHDKSGKAPLIQLFDESKGCSRVSKEYKGKKSGTRDDYLCVVVKMYPIEWSEDAALQLKTELIPTFSPYNRATKGIISKVFMPMPQKIE